MIRSVDVYSISVTESDEHQNSTRVGVNILWRREETETHEKEKDSHLPSKGSSILQVAAVSCWEREELLSSGSQRIQTTMAKSTKSLSFFCVIVVLSSFIVLVQCQFGRNRKQKSKVTEANVCQLEADPGQCSETIRKFYFDVRSGECKMFDWSGCDGNGNRFNSKRICEKKCRAEKGGVKRCPSLDCDARRSPCRFGRAMDANGCETCHCRTTPACPQDQCFIQCPFGYAEDEHGCRLCECLPPTCPPFSCRIHCQHGFKSDPLGCKICICEEGGTEEEKEKEKQEAVMPTCSPLMCAMHCERGYVKDSHGCNVCQCVGGPQTMTTAPRDRCGPRPMCAMHCPLGFQNDTEGCSVCRCVEAPPPPPPPPPQVTTARAPVDRCSLRPVCRMYCADGFVKDADGCDRCECLQRPPPPPSTPPTTAVAASCTPMSWFWCWKVCAHGFAKGPDGCDKCECHVPGEAKDAEEEEDQTSQTEREGWEVEPDPEPELSRRCSPVQCRMYCKHGFQTDDHGCEICKCRQVEEEERERVPASCSPITCYMYCQHGFEKDERGCDRCRCAVPPSTVPSPLLHRTPGVDRCQGRRPACRMFCPYGYERDADGCDRCACFSPTDSVDYARARQATARCSSDRRCSTQCVDRGGFKTDAYGCMLCECVEAEEEQEEDKKTDSQAVDAVIADARKASCSLSPEVGPCRASRERWHYNPRARRCETFRYGGCRGNANNFLSEKSCIKYCKPEVNQEPTNNWKSRYFRMIGML